MDYYKKRNLEISFLVIGISVIIASFVIAFITKGEASGITTPLLIFGVFVSFVAYAVLEYFDFLQVKKAEETFSRFLRDYSEAINSGINFIQAFDVIIKNDYGALNPYIKRAKYRLSLNIPFPKVLELMKKELSQSKIVSNALDIIINAYYSGGDVGITMMDLSQTLLNIREIHEEKKLILNQQVMIIYAVFIIFLIITVVLYYSLKPLTQLETPLEIGKYSVRAVNFCEEYAAVRHICEIGYVFGYKLEDSTTYLRILLFLLSLVEGIATGIIIGIITENSYKEGLKHVAIFVSLVFLVFGLIL